MIRPIRKKTNRTGWSAKVKYTIIPFLGNTIPAKTQSAIDNDVWSAKRLWEELKQIFTTPIQQEISTHQRELINMIFHRTRNMWDSHVSEILQFIHKISFYEQEISDIERLTKLISSL